MTPRLQTIAAQVPEVSSAIDVGCDHAQVGIWLTQHNIVKKMTDGEGLYSFSAKRTLLNWDKLNK